MQYNIKEKGRVVFGSYSLYLTTHHVHHFTASAVQHVDSLASVLASEDFADVREGARAEVGDVEGVEFHTSPGGYFVGCL